MDFDQPDYEEEHGGDHGDMEDVASNMDIVQQMTCPKYFVDALDVVGHLEGDVDSLFQLRTMGPFTGRRHVSELRLDASEFIVPFLPRILALLFGSRGKHSTYNTLS